MDRDEDFHVEFVYEEDSPPTDAVRSESSFAEELSIVNGAVRGGLYAIDPEKTAAGLTDLPSLEFRFQQGMIHSGDEYEQSHHERLEALVEIVHDRYEASDPKPEFV